MADHSDDQEELNARPWQNLPKSKETDKQAFKAEVLRTRELYRYYVPNDRSTNTTTDDYLHDPSLYAFVRLTAYQLNVKLALLSLIDADTQYLIANSGASTDGTFKVEEFDRRGRLCMRTLVLPPKIPTFELSDLRKEEDYKDIDFVKNKPHMRFYAGTPIKTSNGLNIGTLCLLDDKVRVLTQAEKDSMTMLAGLIMEYLETTRKQREQEIGVRMQSSLGRFVSEGAMRKSLGSRGLGWRSDSHTNLHSEGTKAKGKPSIEQEQSLSKSVQDTYQRAARYIADSMSRVSAIMFVNTDGEVLQEWKDTDRTESSNANAQSSSPKSRLQNGKRPTPSGSSNPERKGSGSEAGSPSTLLDIKLFVRFVSTFPRGRIFTCSALTPVESLADDGYFSSTNSQWTQDDEKAMLSSLQDFVPDCVSAILFPLYDEFGEISSIGTVFTMFETRIFTLEEVNYLNIFGTTIMSEVALLSTISADNEKKKFISSISHELRSPLHGILAGAELLFETDLDSSQVEHLETIQHCGETLLDTLNHVLDYSALDSASIRDAHHIKKTIRNPLDNEKEQQAALSKLERSESGKPREAVRSLDLAELTGEIVDVVLTGHAHKAKVVSSQTDACDKTEDWPDENDLTGGDLVTKIVDVVTGDDWIYEVPSAAYRRILMNLLGNALKYTDKGFVRISLSCKKNASGIDDVELVVSDSGRGIGEDFVSENLFKPFTQEDALAPGTGLGMAIVGLLVQNMGGTIKVESQLGVGSTFIVNFPFRRGLYKDRPRNQLMRKRTGTPQGKLALLVGFSPDCKIDETTILHRRNAVERHLSNLHVRFEHQTIEEYMNDTSPTADLIIVNGLAHKLSLESFRSYFYNPRLPTAILHGNRMLKLTADMKRPGLIFCHLPCGPAKFASTLDALTTTPLRDEMSKFEAAKESHTDRGLDVKFSRLSVTKGIQDHPKVVTPPVTPPMSVTSIKPRILVVDDNPINLKLLVQMLKIKGYQYQVAENGLIALEKFKSHPKGFDVVLMDLQMPVMNGIDSSIAIREYENTQKGLRSKIIALTGLAAKNDMNEAMNAGMDMFWTKPVSMKSLMIELNAWEVRPQ